MAVGRRKSRRDWELVGAVARAFFAPTVPTLVLPAGPALDAELSAITREFPVVGLDTAGDGWYTDPSTFENQFVEWLAQPGLPPFVLLPPVEVVEVGSIPSWDAVDAVYAGRHQSPVDLAALALAGGSRFMTVAWEGALPSVFEQAVRPDLLATGGAAYYGKWSLLSERAILGYGNGSEEPFVLLRLDDELEPLTVEAEVRELLGGIGRYTPNGVSVLRSDIGREVPEFTSLHPDHRRHRAEAETLGRLTPLLDLFEIVTPTIDSGFHGETQESVSGRTFRPEDVPPTCEVMDGRIVSVCGFKSFASMFGEAAADLDEWDRHRVPSSRFPYMAEDGYLAELAVADLVVPKGPEEEYGPWFFGVVEADSLPMAADRSVVVLRPKERRTVGEVRFVAEFLAAERRRGLLRSSRGKEAMEIMLSRLEVPSPDDDVFDARESLRSAAADLHRWAAEARDLNDNLFAAGNFADARQNLLSNGRRISDRVVAARLVDDFGARVRLLYPFPLAYRWRTVEASPKGEKIGPALACAEVFLTYGAILAMRFAATAGIELRHLAAMADRMEARQAGPGFGDWTAILREVKSKRFRVPAGTPLQEVRELLADDTVDAAVGRLAARRNDLAHLRGPTTARQLADVEREAMDDLIALASAFEAITDYQLRLVERVQWDSILRTGVVTYRTLRGDSHVVPMSSETTTDVLDTGALYVRQGRKDWLLLKPFLLGQECPTCGTWSTFHLDNFDTKSQNVRLKSLEHGHSVDRPETAPWFRSAGMLRPG